MTNHELTELVERMWKDCQKTMNTKGLDYSSTTDRLSNFKEVAGRLGLTPYQAWSAYFLKHVDSVINAIRRNPHRPTKEGEPLSENFKDIIVYAFLGAALLQEEEPEVDMLEELFNQAAVINMPKRRGRPPKLQSISNK